MPASRAIVVFAKYPVPGRVKTRLIGRLSPAEAAELYRACLALTLECLDRVPDIATILAASPDEADFSDTVGP
ncbi:MAG: glycosyltransferase, partial [Planctomycetota bacterium]|nr:glycosyltransferase [Planctomycetota bacterium]